MSNTPGFWARNEFILRRLHSLSGLIPVGAYMCIHLAVNSSVFFSESTFQRLVFHIHAIGDALPVIEWAFIFLPIIFHAVYGLFIMKDASPNLGDYKGSSNFRYTMQRASGMIAFFFILYHVFHMHGWIHADFWLSFAESFGGAQFSPYNASSSAASAMQNVGFEPWVYGLGVAACVFHLANGIFTMGITWGVWISPKAQNCAAWFTIFFGFALFGLGLLPVFGLYYMSADEIKNAKESEDKAYELLVQTGDIPANDHKRSGHHDSKDEVKHDKDGENEEHHDEDDDDKDHEDQEKESEEEHTKEEEKPAEDEAK